MCMQVVDVQFFRHNQDIQDFTTAVDLTSNIYNRRWGDAPLRYLAVQFSVDVAVEVKEFCEIDYEHQGRWEATC